MRQTPKVLNRNSKAGLTDAQWTGKEKIKINTHPIIHCPMSKGVSERSKQGRASERISGVSERTSEWNSISAWILDCSGPRCNIDIFPI